MIAACAAYAAYCLFVASAGIGTSPDTEFYLSFSPLYPAGYPLFLKLLGQHGAVIVQPLLFAAVLSWLGLETLREWSSLPLALSVVVASVAAPNLPSLHASLLTESLFITGEVAVIAATMRFARAPGWQTMLLAAACGALAATVRNAGYVFLPVLVVATMLQWHRIKGSRGAVLAAAVLPMVLSIGVERGVAHLVNGEQATSLFGRHMFAKAALIDAPRASGPLDPARTIIEDHLEQTFAPIRRTLASAPPSIRSLLAVYYETCLQGPCTREMRDKALPQLSEAQQNDVIGRIALQRIVSAPLAFVDLTIGHETALWTAYKQRHPATTPILNEFLATHRPLPFENLALSWRDPSSPLQFEPDPRVRFLQPAIVAVAWITGGLALVSLIFAARRRAPRLSLATASVAALTAHAGVLFSATFAPGISRFTVSFWPAVMISLVFAVWALVDRRGNRLRLDDV